MRNTPRDGDVVGLGDPVLHLRDVFAARGDAVRDSSRRDLLRAMILLCCCTDVSVVNWGIRIVGSNREPKALV